MNSHDLPTRFHIGTQKAGSTFIYNLLSSHPDVSLSSQTEVHYYSKFFTRGDDWYHSLFSGKGIKIDTSPKYFMRGEDVALRIKKACGEKAKFLLVLRNPIDLLNSHYQMQVLSRHFHNHGDLYPKVPKDVVECVKLYPDYLKQARYNERLKADWLAHFHRSQFKIFIFEKFIKDVDKHMRELQEFWGMELHKLTAQKSSQNRLMRYKTLFPLRSFVVNHPHLKRVLQKSRFFNHVYDHWLTHSSGKAITKEQRLQLRELLADDVTELKNTLHDPLAIWPEFKTKN